MARVSFKRIRERAAKRKGGEKALASLLPKKRDNKALAKLGDDRVLAEMARRVFSAGFVWSVIDQAGRRQGQAATFSRWTFL